ncbi:serine hydrolase [Pontibacter silvestris]|uniref:Serine hydrolase n=1 Tax=Pontibacter silvestris TaxID=2305183 RepID=A0ABW4WY52_9BACT|nr:serine hydrolase [Pontibacter silvestris]MCC9136555.1 serine hydrolase [Pontibacter silvestris]
MNNPHTLPMQLRVMLMLVLSLLIHSNATAQQVKVNVDLAKLDAYYEQALKDWNVPGMAIAIVKDDSVIFAKGYGVQNNQTGGPVDANTIFGIASNTKAYTAAALGILVDQGKIKWEDKVTTYLPYLKLYDPYVTENLTIEDLLCHRVGFKTYSGDLLWYNTTYSRPEILQRVRYLEPAYGFRNGYGYSNLMFIAAGEVIETVSGQKWESFIKEHFFQPLGMTRSYTSVNDLNGAGNVASPHGFDAKGKPYVTTFTAWDNWNPAAGIFTSVNQDAQWLRLQLNRGTYKGKRIFSEDASRNMWTAHNPFPVSKQSETVTPSTHFSAAGLGWMLDDYEGRKVVAHGGGHEGMNSRTVLVPEENLGMVIFTNSMSSIMAPIASYTLDQFFGIVNGRDWSRFALEAHKAAKQANSNKEPEKKVRKSKPTMELTAYAGTYNSQLYGNATVTIQNGQLVLQLVPAPALGGTLTYWQHDIFNLSWKNNFALLTPTNVRFLTGEDGKIAEMRLDANNPDFHFDELKFVKVN